MKIAILQGAFLPIPPELGGAVEKMWFALGKEFARRGHHVIQISKEHSNFPLDETIEGVKHKRVKGFATPSSGFYLKLLDLIYTVRAKSVVPKNIDIVVTNTFWAPIILSAKVRKRCFVDVARIPKGQMRLYKKVARLRANSNFVAEAIGRELSEDKRKKVITIPNPLPFNLEEKLDFTKKRKLLLYTGRIHPEKGLDILIMAFKEIKTDWLLKIVGPWDVAAGGGGQAYLNFLKNISGNSSNIQFIGPVYDINVLNEFYSEASIFVYPSVAEQGETFGLAPLEAMAWGCVPIVSDLSCFNDFIIDNVNGLIFNHRCRYPHELLFRTIQKLVLDPDLTFKLANKAIEVRNSHSISSIAGEFLREFDKIISEKELK